MLTDLTSGWIPFESLNADHTYTKHLINKITDYVMLFSCRRHRFSTLLPEPLQHNESVI